MSGVNPTRVPWLWPNWLPLGKLVIVDGDPSVGKSTVAMDIAARVSTGSPWPDGAANTAGDVLLMSAEDGLADTIRPRIDAASGDASRIHALPSLTHTAHRNAGPRRRPVTLQDIDDIEQAVAAVQARLLIIDVLMAYLPPAIDSHRDQDVRAVLAPLTAMAERQSCTVVALRHLNKTNSSSAIYRGGGSIGIIGAARAALLAATDPRDPTRRVLAPIKSNLAATPLPLVYQLTNAPEHGCARVTWLGPTNITTSELLQQSSAEEAEETDELTRMLRHILDDANGEIPAADVRKKLRSYGATPSNSALYRARKRIGLESRKGGYHVGWIWRYRREYSTPHHEETEESGSHAGRNLRNLPESFPR